MEISMKTLMMEASVIAGVFVVLGSLVHIISMGIFKEKAMSSHTLLALQAAITAASFHIICELTNVNAMYCKKRVSNLLSSGNA
jgi:hypothetical protein